MNLPIAPRPTTLDRLMDSGRWKRVRPSMPNRGRLEGFPERGLENKHVSEFVGREEGGCGG